MINTNTLLLNYYNQSITLNELFFNNKMYALVFIFYVLSTYYQTKYRPKVSSDIFKFITAENWKIKAVLAIIYLTFQILFEEIVFRQYTYNELKNYYSNDFSVVLASFLFGLSHSVNIELYEKNLNSFIGVTFQILRASLFGLYINLITPILWEQYLIHYTYNIISVVFAILMTIIFQKCSIKCNNEIEESKEDVIGTFMLKRRASFSCDNKETLTIKDYETFHEFSPDKKIYELKYMYTKLKELDKKFYQNKYNFQKVL